MISYYTKLPLREPYMTELELYEFTGKVREYSIYSDTPFFQSQGQDFFPLKEACSEVECISSEDGNHTIAEYMLSDGEGISLKYTFAIDRQQGQLVAYCKSALPNKLPDEANFLIQYAFFLLINSGRIGADQGLEVLTKPHILSTDNEQEIAKAILREKRFSLPLIFVSQTRAGNYQIDAELLAKKFMGLAHVVKSDGGESEKILSRETSGKSPYDGCIGLFFPNTGKSVYLTKNAIPRSELIMGISYQLRKDMRRNMVPDEECCAVLMRDRYAVKNSLLEEKIAVVKEENDAVYDTFGSELEQSIEREKRLRTKNTMLQNEVAALRRFIKSCTEIPLLTYHQEDDFYPGEIRDIIMDVLADASENLEDGTRRKDVIRKVLDANKFDGAQRERKRGIKNIFKKNKIFNHSMANDLEKYGLKVIRSNSHYTLKYYDMDKNVTVAKTPSDVRGFTNLAQTIIKKYF